jgi:hypothetical protein
VKLYSTSYRLVLRVSTREGDPPAVVRMRQALKTLLRCYGVRCVSVEEVAPPSPTATPALPGADGASRGEDAADAGVGGGVG